MGTNNEISFWTKFAEIAQVKKLANTIKYISSIIAISNNIKIKERLRFSLLLDCVVGSTLSTELTKVFTYEDIYQIVDMIKSHNAIASQILVPKFLPSIIAMIANQRKEMVTSIFKLLKKLLDIIAYLQLKILGFGAD
ncbi:16088_t:CDS:2, partial [Racocetra persica]